MSRVPSHPPTADEIAGIAPEFTSVLNVPLKLAAAAAIALVRVIRGLAPEDYGVDPKAWYRAVDALSPLLPGALECPRPTKAGDRAAF